MKNTHIPHTDQHTISHRYTGHIIKYSPGPISMYLYCIHHVHMHVVHSAIYDQKHFYKLLCKQQLPKYYILPTFVMISMHLTYLDSSLFTSYNLKRLSTNLASNSAISGKSEI